MTGRILQKLPVGVQNFESLIRRGTDALKPENGTTNNNGTQGGTQDGTQGGTQGLGVIAQIESEIINNPNITTEELAKKHGKGVRTIKRYLSKLPHIRYIGSGYSGHWEIIKK